MKKQTLTFVLLLLTAAIMQAQTITGSGTINYIPKFNNSTVLGNSQIAESSGNIGIGLSNPSTRLEVRALGGTAISSSYHSVSPAPDHYLARHWTTGGPPNFTVTEFTDFIIKGDGKTGIGTSTPTALLTIRAKTDVVAPAIEQITTWQNKNGNTIGSFANVSTATSNGGLFYVIALPDGSQAAIAVANSAQQYTPFGVYGNGSVMMGHSTNPGSPTTAIAQLDVRFITPHSYLFNVGNHYGISGTFLNIANNGPVGIGVAAQSGVALTVRGFSTNTMLDLISTSTSPAFIRLTQGTNQVRHQITEANGDLVIQPGVTGGGANGVLDILGDVQIGNKKPVLSQYINSTTGENNLSVNGWVVAKKVMVQTSSWADKVFSENYSLTKLSDLETFIKQHKHLPEIPSEVEVKEKGIDVGEMNKLLLQKVEELTLYLIEQQKQIDALTKK